MQEDRGRHLIHRYLIHLIQNPANSNEHILLVMFFSGIISAIFSTKPRPRVSLTREKTPLVLIIKAGVHMKAVFWLGIMFFMQISCLRFKQSRISLLISHIYVLGCFGNFLVIFRYIWREIVFLKGLVKLMEIGNFEDLLLF